MTHKPSLNNTFQAMSLLMDAYVYLCPKADKNNPTVLMEDMKKDGTYDRLSYCRVLVAGMYDGLAYGNWPSVVNKQDGGQS